MMLRKLSFLTHLGAEGTALKILYAIVDLQEEGKHPNDADIKTDKIDQQDKIVRAFASALNKTIHYSLYQTLSTGSKEAIQKLIATVLSEKSKKYLSTYTLYTHWSGIRFTNINFTYGNPKELQKLGLSTSILLSPSHWDPDVYPIPFIEERFDAIKIHFPLELFLQENLLAEQISKALVNTPYKHLLTRKNDFYLEVEEKIDAASKHIASNTPSR